MLPVWSARHYAISILFPLMCSILYVTADPVSLCLLMQSTLCWRVREASVESPMFWCHNVTECRQAPLFGGSTHPLLQGSAG